MALAPTRHVARHSRSSDTGIGVRTHDDGFRVVPEAKAAKLRKWAKENRWM